MADAAYTLADFEGRAVTPLLKGVIRTWRAKAPIMERMKWKNGGGLNLEMIRTTALPTAAWLKIGEALGNMKGTTEPYVERVYKLGGKIDIPKEYADAKGAVVDERANQESMALEAMACAFNDAFINGDPSVDPDSFVGLWWRSLNQFASAQLVNVNLDISPDTAASNWWFTILDKLDEIRDAAEGGDVDAFILDVTTKQRLESALRRSGLLNFVKDQVGRRFMTLGDGGPLFIEAGYKGNQTNKIIGHVETAAGTALTGGTKTSIYGVKFGEPYVSGFFYKDIDAQDLGMLEDGVNVRTIVDWTPGMYIPHPRSVVRGYNVEAA